MGAFEHATVAQREMYPVAATLHLVDRGAEPDIESLGEGNGDRPADLVVLGAKQLWSALHDRDSRTERAEDVGELAGDEAAAEHDQVLGHRLDAHDVVARVVADLGQAGDVGDHRPRPGGDHDLTCLDAVDTGGGGDLHLPFTDESASSRVHGDVGALVGAVARAAFGDGVDTTEHPVADVEPPHAINMGIDAEMGGVLDGLHDVCRVDEHLRRDATAVETGAAEHPFLHDCDLPVVRRRGNDRVATAGAKDDQVVVLERVSRLFHRAGHGTWTGGTEVTAFHIASSGAPINAR